MVNMSINYLLIILFIFVSSCAKKKSAALEPFRDSKVQVKTENINGLISSQEVDLQVIIDNSCARSLTNEDKESFLGENMNINFSKMLEIPIQSYVLTIDNEMSHDEIENIVRLEECVVGITNNELITIPSEKTNSIALSNVDSTINSVSLYKHLSDMRATTANSIHFSSILNKGNPVVISIIDTGVHADHSDLRNIKFKNGDVNNNFTNDTTANDLNGHGTHVAGLAASMLKFNPNAVRVMNAKGLNKAGSGYSSAIFNAVIYSVHKGADVINMSLSGRFDFSYSVYAEAIGYAVRNNVLVVVAAGNDDRRVGNAYDPDNVRFEGPWPSAFGTISGVINVGSIDTKNKIKSSFSNYGANVDIWAPGCTDSVSRPYTGLVSAKAGGGHVAYCGTSMASPVLAGVAALVIKHYRSQGKGVNISIVEDILKASTSGASNNFNGQIDLVNLASSLKYNRVPQNPDFIIEDSYDQYVSDLYSNFLVKPHLTEETRILADVFKKEKKSFQWLLETVLSKYPRDTKDCNRVIRPLYYAATAKSAQRNTNFSIVCSQYISGKLTLEELAGSIVASKDFLEYIENLGLQNHPVSKLEEGRFISDNEFELRKEIQPIINKYLLRPVFSQDFKFTSQANTIESVKNKIINSNERYLLYLYKEILDRDPSTLFSKDFGGWNYWSGVLNKGQHSRQQVREVFEKSNEKWVRDAYKAHSEYVPYQFQIDKYVNSLNNNSLTKNEITTQIKNYRRPDRGTIVYKPLERTKINNTLVSMYLSEIDLIITDALKKYHSDRIVNLNNYKKQNEALEQLRTNLKNSKEAIIVNMCYDILRRGPSIEERKELLREINSGTNTERLKEIITNLKDIDDSISIPTPNPDTSSIDQIKSVYRDVLNREADIGGLNYWVGQLESGVSIARIRDLIGESKEAQIRNLYLTYLKREPDQSGLDYWIQDLKNGRSLEEIRDNFRRVQECKFDCL